MHIRTTELFSGDLLPSRGFHQWRATKKNRPGSFHDDGFIGHRRDIRTSSGAGAHHCCDLRDLKGGHLCLVVEDPPEMLSVREDLVLHGEERTARVDQVDAGEVVLHSDLLGTKVFFHCDRVIGAAGDGRVIGDDEDFSSMDDADTGDDPGSGRLVFIHVKGRQGVELNEGRLRI